MPRPRVAIRRLPRSFRKSSKECKAIGDSAAGHGPEFVGVGARKETPAEVTFRLPKEQPVRGRVIDPQGKPLAGIRVTVDGVRHVKSCQMLCKSGMQISTDD